MKLAFTTLACPAWDMEQVIRCAVENGYDGVDFRGYQGKIPLPELPEFTTDVQQTARRFREAGLEVPALSSSARVFGKTEADVAAAREEVRRYVEIAPALEAPIVRVFGGNTGGLPWEQALPRAAENLAFMAELAAGHGVTLAVETHDAWVVTEPLGRLIRQVRAAHPNVGVLWDVHHPFQMAGEPIEESYRQIGDLTIYTHVKDSNKRDDGEFDYCLPGQGQVPLDEIVALLARGGYDGYLTLEWEKQWHPEIADPEIALPAYAKALREAIRRARK